jgi:Tfp pilus assembly protein PilF
MRLEYRFLWKISLISVIFGIFYLLGLCCFANVNEELNRKAEELFSQGIQAERQEKNADAEKFYEQCLRLAKENNISRLESPALHRLAILNAKEQKLTESEQYFRDALNLDKENTALLCDFAKLYADQKNYADAETILKNALLIAPDHRRTLYNLGLIIALQNDRQPEGLRYLKLAIGETAAYRELAKIYRQQGNNAQAEFAEQRASILEKTQTTQTTDTKTVPTVPMNDQTKKGLVQRVKEELLRLETAEITETPQNITTKNVTPQPSPLTTEPLQTELLQTEPLKMEPTLTKLLPSKSSSEEPLLTKLLPSKSPSAESLQTESLRTEPLPIKSLQTETTHDPFLVAAESQKVGELQKDQQLTESTIEPFPVETNSNIETKFPEIIKPLQTFPESSRQQVVKILKPEPPTNEPVKTFQQEVQSDQQTNNLRTLPATDFRISNSTENDTDIPQQPEVRPLTIIPLEDAATVKNIPEYTAIGVRKIPLAESGKTTAQSRLEEKNSVITTAPTVMAKTEKNEGKNSVSRFQHPVSSNSAATISISLSKNKTAQNTVSDKTNSDFSARLHLEQPINLITFNSQRSQFQQPQAPVPVLNSSEKLLNENQERPEKQNDQYSRNNPVPHRRTDSEYISQKTQNNISVTNERSVTPQRSTKSILRPGAGKIGIQEELDSYVYVDPSTPKNNVTTKEDAVAERSESAEKNTATKSTPETTLITKSITDSFSLMRPIPGKLANQLADSSRPQPIMPAPSTETETKIITEITNTPAQTKETETDPFPVAKTPPPEIPTPENLTAQNKPDTENNKSDTENIAQTDSETDKKIDVQFSSTQAPTVLKFEIASTTKSENSEQQAEILNDSDKTNKIVTTKEIAALAKPVTIQPETVETDSLPKIADNSFQPPTVLKFAPAQNEIVSKPNLVQPETISVKTTPVKTVPLETVTVKTIPVETAQIETVPVKTVPIETVQPKPIQTEPESVFVQKTEPLLPTPPESVVTTKPDVSPKPTTIETITSAVPATPKILEIPTVPAKPIPQTDSVAISNPKSDPFLSVPASPVQESALPTQQPESKTETEIAGNTLPQPNSAHVEAFLPILITPQPETFFVQKSTVLPVLESPQSEANLKFKIVNETETAAKLPAEQMITQNIDQQLKIITNSDALKFVTPNRPQQNPLPNQEMTVPKPTDKTVAKTTIEIVPKQTEGIVFKPVEVTPKPTNEIVSKPTTEIIPKQTEEIVSKPATEIMPEQTEEIVSKPAIEIIPKQTEEIVFKPIEVVPKPTEETVSKSITKIVQKPESVLTLIPLDVEPAQRTELERPPVQARTRTPITPSETEEVFVLKKIESTQPRLKTELEIAERLALNSISKGTLSDKPDNTDKLNKPDRYKKLTEETEMIEEEEEPVGFATTRKIPPAVVQREVNGTVDDFLKPKENFGKHPIFSMDSSLENDMQEKNVSQNQEPEEDAGFARSSKYSKKTQSDSSQSTAK